MCVHPVVSKADVFQFQLVDPGVSLLLSDELRGCWFYSQGSSGMGRSVCVTGLCVFVLLQEDTTGSSASTQSSA